MLSQANASLQNNERTANNERLDNLKILLLEETSLISKADAKGKIIYANDKFLKSSRIYFRRVHW